MDVIYDKIGDGYDTTRRADPAILATLARLLDVEAGKFYLDLACGTGNYTSGMVNLGGSWFACDGSARMLAEATRKSTAIDWRKYDVEDLGYDAEFFDGAICTLAIHHFASLLEPFHEVARVLKSESRFVIFTSTPEQMYGYWLNHYFPQMMKQSCDQMPGHDAVASALSAAGFSVVAQEPFFVTPELKDFFLYSGKQKPEMYLSEQVRNGISSFHNFCDKSELDDGMTRLRQDIESGNINAVMRDYENAGGDYLFICAQSRDPSR